MLKPKSFTPAYILNFLFLKSQETEFWMGQPGRTVGELSSYAIFPHFFFLQRGEFMKAFALESASGSFLLQTRPHPPQADRPLITGDVDLGVHS